MHCTYCIVKNNSKFGTNTQEKIMRFFPPLFPTDNLSFRLIQTNAITARVEE